MIQNNLSHPFPVLEKGPDPNVRIQPPTNDQTNWKYLMCTDICSIILIFTSRAKERIIDIKATELAYPFIDFLISPELLIVATNRTTAEQKIPSIGSIRFSIVISAFFTLTLSLLAVIEVPDRVLLLILF